MESEYTEFVYVAEDGSFYREADVSSWSEGDDSPPEVIWVPRLCPKALLTYGDDGLPRLKVVDQLYRRQRIKSPLPLTNESIGQIIVHRREMANEPAVEPEPAPSWDWEEPD